jgi:small basic protein (TIGR04137 family)
MSIDKGLKSRSALSRHRNVLSRDERIEAMKADEKWQDGRSPIGLPKVAHRKAIGGKKADAKGEAAKAEETPKK